MKNLRIFTLLTLTVLSLPFIVSCHSDQPPAKQPATAPTSEKQASFQPVDGDWLVTTTGRINTLNFLEAYDTDQLDVVSMVGDCLVTFGPKLNEVPRLAQSWEISKDHMKLVFHLRKGVKFHDGVPFTADDVLYTYRKSLDPSVLYGTYRQNFAPIKDVTKTDDYTVVVTFKEPAANPLSSFEDFFILPKHIYDTRKYSFKDNPANVKPIGTGPYILEEWEKNVQIVLRANPDYFAGRPHLDKIIFKIIDRNAMTFDMLMNGELDLTPISTVEWKYRTNSPEFKSTFQKRKYYILAFFFCGWNEQNPFFKSRDVRQAMAYLADRETFNQNNFFGQYRIAASPVHPESPFFNKDVKPLPFDPQKAVSLLENAGIKDRNGDGIREDNDGTPFTFTFLVGSTDERGERFAEFYQSTLSSYGIKMKIKPVDDANFQELTNSGKYDAYFRGWVTGADPDFLFSIFRTPDGKESFNDIKYSNPELDHLLDLTDKELNADARKNLFMRIQDIIHEDQPYLFLYYPAALIAVHDRFRAVQPSARGIFRCFPGILNTYVPKSLQKHKTQI